MKRIGLLSDTHGYIDDRILTHLNECDEIWHAGDIGSYDLLLSLEKLKPFRGVYGNIDNNKIRHALPEVQRFMCEGTDTLIKHIGGYPGHYEKPVTEILKIDPPKLLITGHSHITRVIFDKKFDLLYINPGAAGINGFHKIRTLVRFTLDNSKISELEVVELGLRG